MNAINRADKILATHNVQESVCNDGKSFFPRNSFILFLEQQQRFPNNEQLQRPRRYNLEEGNGLKHLLLDKYFIYKCKLSKVIPYRF